MIEQPARTLASAARGDALNPLHLVRPGHPWYTNLDALLPAHHYGVTRKLKGLFEESSGFLHIGLVGHAGTGKSTLVRQAMGELTGRGIMPVYVNAEESFDQVDMTFAEVPMIPIRMSPDEPADALDGAALDAIQKVLSKRLVLDEIFAEPRACVAAIARWSGGRLRDIIDLARHACEFADFDPTAKQVSVEHVDRAARKLAGRRLTVMRPECWARAVEIHDDKQIDNRAEDALMLGHSLVLAYDGDPWWDVHPFVLQDRRFKRAAAAASSS